MDDDLPPEVTRLFKDWNDPSIAHESMNLQEARQSLRLTADKLRSQNIEELNQTAANLNYYADQIEQKERGEEVDMPPKPPFPRIG